MTIKLTTDLIRVVGVFERLTGVHVKDCLMNDECAYFLIEPGKLGMAIGKNGSTIKNVSKALGRSIKIFEYSDNAEGMIKNFVPNLKSMEVENGNITITIHVSDRSTVIGKNGKNIKMIREFLKRHFNIDNVRLK